MAEAADRLAVFVISGDGECAECGAELGRGSLLARTKERGLVCLSCADLDHLVWLPPGNAALTRRASKASRLVAVILKFSKARGRYERQGLLVEEAAVEAAEASCLSDAEVREARRLRRAAREADLDADYVRRFAAALRERYPAMPSGEETAVAEHACRKHSGRVGRSAMAKALDAEALDLALRAHVRHVHTEYDVLLSSGVDRDDARSRIRGAVEDVCRRWQG